MPHRARGFQRNVVPGVAGWIGTAPVNRNNLPVQSRRPPHVRAQKSPPPPRQGLPVAPLQRERNPVPYKPQHAAAGGGCHHKLLHALEPAIYGGQLRTPIISLSLALTFADQWPIASLEAVTQPYLRRPEKL